MIHPHTEVRFVNEVVGRGVFATAAIPMGTVIWVKDGFDRTFSPAEVAALDEPHREILESYSYRNASGGYVFCWDNTRFMNHSFYPNCLPTPYGVEIAVRDIAAGEEITNDYGCFNIIEAFAPADEGHERKEVRPDDLLRFHAEWDQMISVALRQFPAVSQPLKPFFREGIEEHLLAIVAGTSPPQSIQELYFRGGAVR